MTPLILLVGFLGSGKTTLLRTLVPRLIAAGQRPSVILNDYQNARIDAEYFREMATTVQAISGSCVCCASRHDLLAALDEMPVQERGLVLVETNGTTDAEELVTFLAADPHLRRYTLPWQISVVDVKRWQKRFWHNRLEADQVRTASVLFLAHADQVDPRREAAVGADLSVRSLAPKVRTLEEIVADILEIQGLSSSENERPAQSTESASTARSHEHEHEHEHHHEHGHHHDAAAHHFAACEVRLPSPLDEAVFQNALADLPEEVLRVKGLAFLRTSADEAGGWFIFQKIGRYDAMQMAPLGGDPVVGFPLAVFVGAQLPENWPATFRARLAPLEQA